MMRLSKLLMVQKNKKRRYTRLQCRTMVVSLHLMAKVRQKDPMLVVTLCIKNQYLKPTTLNLDYKSILIQKSFSSTI